MCGTVTMNAGPLLALWTQNGLSRRNPSWHITDQFSLLHVLYLCPSSPKRGPGIFKVWQPLALSRPCWLLSSFLSRLCLGSFFWPPFLLNWVVWQTGLADSVVYVGSLLLCYQRPVSFSLLLLHEWTWPRLGRGSWSKIREILCGYD